MMDDNGNISTSDEAGTLSEEDIQAMEDERVRSLEEAGIDEQAVLQDAMKGIAEWSGYWSDNRNSGEADAQFLFRSQWTDVEQSAFARNQCPALTVNKLRDSHRKILGEQRKNTPDLKVRSITGKASQEALTLRSDIVKTIAYQSRNNIVYQTAFDNALSTGYGAFEVCVDYEDYKSFRKIIKYLRIPDANDCGFDPRAIEATKEDGNYCYRRYKMSREEFHATYPHIEMPQSYNSGTIDDRLDFEWITDDSITICVRHVKEWYPVTIYELSNGESVTKETYDALVKLHKDTIKHVKSGGNDELVKSLIHDRMTIPTIVDERQSQHYKIMCYRLIKDKVLEFYEWKSKYLPIIFVDCDSFWFKGKQYTRSFIHDAKDVQRFLNYLASQIAGQVKNMTRGQYVGTAKMVQDNMDQWINPEVQQGILLVTADPAVPGGLPRKDPPSEIPQTLLMQYQRATADIKEVLGFFDADLGAGSPDLSGNAVDRKAMQGASGTFIFFDNLNRAIEQGGRVTLDLLPYVYDDERPMVVNSKNGVPKNIIINEKVKDPQSGMVMETKNAIDEGEYDLEIDVGPSFAIQKEQAVQMLIDFVKIAPQAFPLVADIIAKNMDIEERNQLIDRLKTLVPPQILAKENGEPPPPASPPSPEEKMMAMEEKKMQLQEQQMQAKNQIDQATLQEKAADLQLRKDKHRIDEIQLRLDALELQHKIKNDAVKNDSENHKAELGFAADIARLISDHKLKSQPVASASD